ncbi:MAG: thioredoxin domain-containing protein [Phycisphaeraceae bacterium]
MNQSEAGPARRQRIGRVIGAWLLAAAAWLAGVPAQANEGEAIPFAEFREAVQAGAEQRHVTVVYFTADWCTWCQRMERVSFRDERALRAVDRFQWAKVDVDAQPYLAGAFGIRGVPAMAFLNAEGELLELRNGYVNPDAFHALLAAHADQAEALGQLRRDMEAVTRTAKQLIDADDEQVDAAVLEAVAMLAEREVAGHQVAQQSVLEMGPRAWPALASALNDDRLAVRAAAYELLRTATEASHPFDPFAEADERLVMAARWHQWVHQQVEAEPVDDEKPAEGEPGTDE